MEGNKYQEECAVEQTLVYNQQVQQLHKIADQLYSKVRHISTDMDSSKTDEPRPPHLTPLNRELEDVIRHFENILDGIEN